MDANEGWDFDTSVEMCNWLSYQNVEFIEQPFPAKDLEKSKKLIFCIVSNVNFPEIKIKFVNGEELANKYPTGVIPLNDHNKFFD